MLRHGALAADVAQLVMDVAEPGDVASADLLRRAAEQIGRVSPAVAAPLSRRALDLMPRGDPGRGEAVVQAIDLLVQAGRAAEAARLLTASESDLADPAAEAQARLGIGMLMTQYAPAAVAEQCQAALRLPGVPPAMRIQLGGVAGLTIPALARLRLAIRQALPGRPDVTPRSTSPVCLGYMGGDGQARWI